MALLTQFKGLQRYIIICLLSVSAYAGNPVWTFDPDPYFPPNISITSQDTAYIQYVVTNRASKPHLLEMKPIPGITQLTTAGACSNTFVLRSQESCLLTLRVDARNMNSSIRGGPVVCQHGNALMCYQPGINNILNITLIPTSGYLITPITDTNGSISPNTPQTVVRGGQLTLMATANIGYQVDNWLVDGGIVQKGGATFTLSNILANHTVEATFTKKGALYAGTLDHIYYSIDNGSTWTTSTIPSASSVNCLFAINDMLYFGSSDGHVYFSSNNGQSWNNTSYSTSSINSIFVTTSGTIYAGTQDGHLCINGSCSSPEGTGAINGVFVTAAGVIYIGRSDGHVYYSTTNASTWLKINGPNPPVPIQNLFVVNNQLYVNTRQTSSNPTLPNNTIDFEYTYISDSATTSAPQWSVFSQITYSLFVSNDANKIYAGTQDGYIYSLTNGNEIAFLSQMPITSLFFVS